MPSIKDFAPRLEVMLTELDRRATAARKNTLYLDGCAPVPKAVQSAKLTKAYDMLMPMSSAPWAALAVDSVQDRLEIGGIRTGDVSMDERLWREVWQPNALDSQSKLAHNGILTNGRAFATSWPDPATGEPEIVLDSAEQMIVLYAEGRHQARHRIAALRRWCDEDDRHYLTYYTPTALYKFQQAAEQRDVDSSFQAGGKWWEKREESTPAGEPEPWPLPNQYNVVPVVELLTNRRLKSGGYPYARGEFEHCLGLLDRINLLTFLGLVVAVWMGFPLRGVVGDKILRDDDGNALPPFESKPDSVMQFESPEAKLVSFDPADRKNLSIFGELAQFAYVTKSPAHYFPMESGLSNISADMIRALEGGLHAKVDGIHKPFIGESWEEVVLVGGLMLPEPIKVPRSTEMWWLDKQSRSLAEMADAAVKLKDLLPNTFIAEKYLGFTQEEISRIQADTAGSALDQLLRSATTNGNGAGVPVGVG